MDEQKKFELMKLEISLLQDVFNKYDDWILKIRFYSFIILISFLGLYSTREPNYYSYYITFVPIFLYIHESFIRYKYLHKFEQRFRQIRNQINIDDTRYPTFDPTAAYTRKGDDFNKKRIKNSFLKKESIIYYMIQLIFTASILILFNNFIHIR